ncbi:type II toxin-antitoxin system HicA family toxin [Paraburkholderia sp. EG304]|uniref:type II toxin-antitoxin system HicA family toxin n=1 Tax=Paraburkholderia sp. EG304 TaxID=3237015 RepID=UPI003978A829
MDFAPEVKKILRDNGCKFYREGRGDHSIWETPGGHRFPVDSKIKSRHTANGIMKQAGIKHHF